MKLCICQICVCGRHRCPHRPHAPLGKTDQPCVLTEYNNRYTKHPLELRQPFKPAQEPLQATGPLYDKTTNRVDFIPHPLSKPDMKKAEEYIKPGGDIDFVSSYKKEYTEKHGPLTKAVKPQAARKIQGLFQGEPTYRKDYRKWPMAPTKAFSQSATWNPPEAPFAGKTTVQHDFISHPLDRRQMFRPAESAHQSEEPFLDATNYKVDYIKHPLPPKEERKKEEYNPNKIPLDALTTAQRDFTQHPQERTVSFKPEQGAQISDTPFDDRTTFKSDFKKWPMSKPFIHEQDVYTKPGGDIDFHTTHKVDFTKHPMERVEAKRPAQAKRVEGKFDGHTNYRHDFQRWPLGRPTKSMISADYAPPEAPFQGMSQYTSHYIPHPLTGTRAFRPAQQAVQGGDFDGNTMYRVEYTPKKSEPCPAALLDTNASNYVYREEAPTGHKFYQPIKSNTKPTALPEVRAM